MYIVITGTSRGIGLALIEKTLSLGHHVLAIARNPDTSEDLGKLKRYPHLKNLPLDLQDKDAHEKIAKEVELWAQVDLLINNAGIYEKDETLDQFEKSSKTDISANDKHGSKHSTCNPFAIRSRHQEVVGKFRPFLKWYFSHLSGRKFALVIGEVS